MDEADRKQRRDGADGRTGLGRRQALAAGLGAGVLGAAGLVIRNQIRHPHKDKRSRPDGRFRRLTLACPHGEADPVLLAAEQGGIFARYNLDVTLLRGADTGAQALDQLKPGGADGAVAPVLSWLPKQLAGLDARMIAGLQSGSSRLLLAHGSAVRRIEDLFHKSIGIADASGGMNASADRLFFSIIMRRKGMNPNTDVSWVEMPPAEFGPALAAKRVAAVAGHDPVVWQLRDEGKLPELASSMTGSYGTRISRALGLRSDLLHADPAAAVALVMAVEEAERFVAKHRDAVASMLTDQLPEIPFASMQRMLAAEGHDVHPEGRELRIQIAQYVDELKLLALVPDDADSAQLSRRYCDTVVHK